DQGVVVRRLDAVEALQRVVGVLVGALVVVAVGEVLLVVLRAVRQRVGAEVAPRDGVLDVLGDDRRAVLVLQPLLELDGVGLAVVAHLGLALGQVGHDGAAVLARGGVVGVEGAGVVPAEVPDVAVVGVARVGALDVGRDGVAERAALLLRRVDDLGDPLVELGVRGVTAAATAAACGQQEDGRGRDRRAAQR